MVAELFTLPFQVADVTQQTPQQEAMVLGAVAFQRQPQFRNLRTQPPQSQLCQLLRVLLAPQQGRQHRTARLAQHVGGYCSQLDVGVLQQLVDAVDRPRVLADKLRPMSRQVPQLAHRTWRHKTASQQATL